MTSLFSKKNLLWVVFFVVVLVGVQFLIDVRIITPFQRLIIYGISIYIILGVSLNIIIGITGQLSLGHAGFMSIGAYSTAIVLRQNPTLTGLFIGMAVGFVISLVVSFLVAMPTLRLKGDYLAIATLGVGEIIRIVILNMQITDGARGISNIPNLISWPMMFVFVVLSVVLASNFKNSAVGRACIAIKEDEIAAESLGVNPVKYKVTAFMIGAIMASIAGALYATTYYVVKPETFGINTSINILIIVVFGGMGSLSGSVFAAIFIGFINMMLQRYAEVRAIIYPAILILVMIFRPQGLLGRKEVTIFTFKDDVKRLIDHILSIFKKKEKQA
jgi:branched-chain amino acid transport system permease protein